MLAPVHMYAGMHAYMDGTPPNCRRLWISLSHWRLKESQQLHGRGGMELKSSWLLLFWISIPDLCHISQLLQYLLTVEEMGRLGSLDGSVHERASAHDPQPQKKRGFPKPNPNSPKPQRLEPR